MSDPIRPKVLIVNSTLHIGGAEEVIATLCRHIDKTRFDIAVCFLKEQGTVGEKILAEGTEVFGIPRSKRFRTDYFTAFRLRKILRERDIQLVHSHDVHSMADTTLCRLSRSGIQNVHTFHYGHYPHREKPIRNIEAACWRFVDRLVAVSRAQAATIADFYGIPDGRIHTLWNGVDRKPARPAPDFIEHYRNQRKAIIGCINTLIPQKGMFDLLEVASRLKRQGLRDHVFLVAGDGHLRAELEERRQAMDLERDVVFLGWVEDAAAIMMDHIDIFFQPSLWEAMSIVLLEAMAAERPIVATRVGETSHVVDAGRSAILVEPGDVGAMADALAELLRAPDRRRALGTEAARRHAQHFTAHAMVERHMSLYDSLLSRRPRRAGFFGHYSP